MWTVRAEPVDNPASAALLRAYFRDIVERYQNQEVSEAEVDATLEEFPTVGLAAFLVLYAVGEPAGCVGLYPDGSVTRVWVAPQHRRQGGARALLDAVEETARAHGITRLRLDVRTDLTEARALYASHGYTEVAPFNQDPYADHFFEKHLTRGQTH